MGYTSVGTKNVRTVKYRKNGVQCVENNGQRTGMQGILHACLRGEAWRILLKKV
jgi:hypothetical protein